MVTSLRIANPNWWIHNAQFACIDVEIILCDFSFRANLHVMRYLGFGIDIFERIDLIIMKPYPISRVDYSSSTFSICSTDFYFLCDFDSNLMASFYSSSPHDEESVVSLIHVV